MTSSAWTVPYGSEEQRDEQKQDVLNWRFHTSWATDIHKLL